MIDLKPCLVCDVLIPRPYGESVNKYQRRKYCGNTCRGKGRALDAQARAVFTDCHRCGGEFRVEEGTRTKYCSWACYTDSDYVIGELDFLIGTDAPRSLAARLGYTVPSLVNMLRKHGRYDLAWHFDQREEMAA